MKKIRDPIHKDIYVDDATLALLDTPKFQRLRRIHQMGIANLVYPGANHTRFEHSLGAFHLAGQAARGLGLSKDDAVDVKAAALLHDVGHGPFSHLTDFILMDYAGRGHVDVSREAVQQGRLKDALEAGGADPARVAALIGGEGPLSTLISGSLDCDRMDYLVRDAHYTGVNIAVDLERLVGELRLTPEGVAMNHGGVSVGEMLLVTRFMMYRSVYYHHASRVAESMVDRAVRLAIDAGEIQPHQLPNMDDYALVHILRQSKTDAWRLMLAVDQRKLYKIALEVTIDDVGEETALTLPGDRHRKDALEARIADEAGVDAKHLIVDAPAAPKRPEIDTRVIGEDGALRSLTDHSHLMRALAGAARDAWRLRVVAPASRRDAVADAARRALPDA